ncbi:PREDICTED: CASP-like protein 4A2, partial [Hipposideros armiger]|uniref:CASP-like protein 4A2 n=1 Tax=Hipposideros armiger TaxID=186990 RepID=A0A8B7QG86_HIPAR
MLDIYLRAAPGGAGCGGGAGAVRSRKAAVRRAIGKFGCAVWRPEARAALRVRWVPGPSTAAGRVRSRPGAGQVRWRLSSEDDPGLNHPSGGRRPEEAAHRPRAWLALRRSPRACPPLPPRVAAPAPAPMPAPGWGPRG